MAETPTNSEFSTWLKEMQGHDAAKQKAADERHKKRWDEMGSDAEPNEIAERGKPPTDDPRVTG